MTQTSKSSRKELDAEIVELSDIRDGLVSEISELELDLERQRETPVSESESDAPVDCEEDDESRYVFDEGDKAAADFDQFFSTADPEVEKIRDDLLNDSPPRRRFAALSARLSV